LVLLLLSPLIAVIAILIKLSDAGPILYPHTRVGKWGREFRCLKFRTMVVNADHLKPEIAHLNTHEDDRTFKVPDDPRVTWIGRLLRRMSLDEVPQLWNVFQGSMSLVGPRPPVVQEVELYDLDDMQRLMVKPGLTCIWQVSGRSRLPFTKQLEMDMAYIQNRGYWLDLKLMLKTLPAVLSADGAY
jgi:lipopolysaccharide/colanic/teichoic acid biosynthesis glycosyltransferase